MSAAEAGRDEGMAATENAADPRVMAAIDDMIAEFNWTGSPWSVNNLRNILPVADHRLIGARVRAAAMRRPREMTKVGSTPSNLASTHTKDIAVWCGVRS